jgi:hypothetical protein
VTPFLPEEGERNSTGFSRDAHEAQLPPRSTSAETFSDRLFPISPARLHITVEAQRNRARLDDVALTLTFPNSHTYQVAEGWDGSGRQFCGLFHRVDANQTSDQSIAVPIFVPPDPHLLKNVRARFQPRT